MNTLNHKIIIILASAMSVLSCSYLDVVPPEQPDLDDMMVDDITTLKMLYSCYSYAQNANSLRLIRNLDVGGTDESVRPQEWENYGSRVQWNAITPSSINDATDYPWEIWYNGIGYCNLFLKLIEESNPVLNPNDREQYICEAKFLKAYYHFRLLQMYGPIPIVDSFMDSDTPKEDFPGRSHFDYCVKYISDLLDEAAMSLPPVYTNTSYFGRATSVACKAIKARLLILAASPIWNGSFPDRTWKNKSYETPGYGYELVSHQEDRKKWETARDAVYAAIQEAESIGAKLFDISESEIIRENQQVPLPDIPGMNDDNDTKVQEFKKKVMMLRYLHSTRPDQGNMEIIWGMVYTGRNWDDDPTIAASCPHFVLKNNQGVNVGGWGGLSPTMYTVEHFYTSAGLLPEDDPGYVSESQYLQSAGLSSNSDIININVGREPRYYAWISFDGDQYSTKMAAGKSLYCDFKDNTKAGYDAAIWGTRNYCVTGFLNKKFINPNFMFTGDSWNNNYSDIKAPFAIVRLGELYLSMAECEAQLGNTDEALIYLNKIRSRAGIPEWTQSSLAETGKTILEAVLDERFIECFLEGYRFYDLRRYLMGADRMGKDCYTGLNAVQTSPSFSVFNTLTSVNQPFDWNDRMYLLPVSNKEVYSNPNMVQAPGY